jgi:hypothetical protein
MILPRPSRIGALNARSLAETDRAPYPRRHRCLRPARSRADPKPEMFVRGLRVVSIVSDRRGAVGLVNLARPGEPARAPPPSKPRGDHGRWRGSKPADGNPLNIQGVHHRGEHADRYREHLTGRPCSKGARSPELGNRLTQNRECCGRGSGSAYPPLMG